MFSHSLLAVLVTSLITPSAAYIRFSCANHVVEERFDPIVNPGAVSAHAHKIAGGNGFGSSMDYAQARASQCSSCPIEQDFSNYWTPKLYFQGADGSFTSVSTVGDNAQDLNGGMTVYYQQRGPAYAAGTLLAFPEGFRMLAGDNSKRNFTGGFDAQAVSYACLGGSTPETNGLPDYNCPSGLRAQIYFPSCWDGVNLDSTDHKLHMAYPASGAYNNGPCPASHPVQLVSLFFEVLYDTNSFASQWPSSTNPFVFANGDATGYGYHGDFVNGWDVPTLQAVVDTCTNDALFGATDSVSCPPITSFTSDQQNACKLPSQIAESVVGNLATLPGCNPVTHGPEPVLTPPTCAGQVPATIGAPETYFTDLTASLGWAYQGCATDGSTRTLDAKTSIYLADVGATMTVEYCVGFCAGYAYAGVEYGTQCYCGDSVAADRAPQDGILGGCNMKCSGDDGEYCGGSNALSLYMKCADATDCQNVGFSFNNGTAVGAVAASSVSMASVAASSAAKASVATSSVSKASVANSLTSKSSIPSSAASKPASFSEAVSGTVAIPSTLANVVKALSAAPSAIPTWSTGHWSNSTRSTSTVPAQASPAQTWPMDADSSQLLSTLPTPSALSPIANAVQTNTDWPQSLFPAPLPTAAPITEIITKTHTITLHNGMVTTSTETATVTYPAWSADPTEEPTITDLITKTHTITLHGGMVTTATVTYPAWSADPLVAAVTAAPVEPGSCTVMTVSVTTTIWA